MPTRNNKFYIFFNVLIMPKFSSYMYNSKEKMNKGRMLEQVDYI